MKKLLTSRQMRECDYSTISNGTPSSELMERAAAAVVDNLLAGFDVSNTLVVCGSGNNGGDGILVAIILNAKGHKCDIWYVGNEHTMSEETESRYNEALDCGVPFVDVPEVEEYSVIVDAILGTGLNSPPNGLCEDAIVAINSANVPVVSIDIPSGISSDNGDSLGESVISDLTVSMEAYKRGHALSDGINASGIVVCADLGIDTSVATDADGIIPFAIEKSDLKLIPRRAKNSHKGTFGRVLVIAGSKGMCGAAFLSAAAAYRSGAGIVEVYTPEDNREIIQTLLPEAIVTVYPDTGFDISGLRNALQRSSVVVIGPGIGNSMTSILMVKEVYKHSESPLIIDADALNITAREGLKYPTDVPVIITPHLGEMARLCKKSVKEIESDIWKFAIEYSRENDIICVCKSARTVITDGTNIFVNMSGGPALAKGGSGDVLTGVIAGMLCSGLSPIGAASIGSYIHGCAGDVATEKLGEFSCLARDVIECIPVVLKSAGGKL